MLKLSLPLCFMMILIFPMSFSRANHPMLFYDEKDIPIFQEKARTTHINIAAKIRAARRDLKEKHQSFMPPESYERFASKWNEGYGNFLGTFAFYCVLYPDDKKALNLVKMFMDRMASYPDWYVTSSKGLDQVPIGHSLTGFATAFDFLYPSLDGQRRITYLKKIRETTQYLHLRLKEGKSGWTNHYIHNHSPTIVLALLMGAMVCERHDETSADLKTTQVWKQEAIDHFEKGLEILKLVTDGTSDEGVAYGSYSSRGWTQYVYLAKRHFSEDHTRHPWFHQHFWYFYGTVLPGYQKTVGIADSNHNWFHGPESQLVFLDAFVLRNGYGNWLADKISVNRAQQPPLMQTTSQVYSTTHTEFIFYDAAVTPKEPPTSSDNNLFFYSDWGVVTYGAAPLSNRENTFLSMKSGAIHGEGVADIVESNLLGSFVKGWRNFNAGHEHPDQNSFVFSPNGQPFITEALYSIKETYLNNVLMFAPHQGSKCNAPWVGQMGECSKWLDWKIKPVPRGKIVTASQNGGMVHIAGEAVQSYSHDLGLKSVQRSMVLLDSNVLLVLDSVYLHEGSKLTRASAFFHNIMHPFYNYKHGTLNGAQVQLSDGNYSMFWHLVLGESPTASLHSQTLQCEYKTRTTNYVNVTYNLRHNGATHMAYVLFGPNAKVEANSLQVSSDPDLTNVALVINDVKHTVSFASLMTSLKTRMRLFGFGSYAQVETAVRKVVFGTSEKASDYNRCDAIDADDFASLISSSATSFAKKQIWDGRESTAEKIIRPKAWVACGQTTIVFGEIVLVVYIILVSSGKMPLSQAMYAVVSSSLFLM